MIQRGERLKEGELSAKLCDKTGAQIASGRFSGDSISGEMLSTDASQTTPCYLEFNCQNGEQFSYGFE